MVVPQEQLGDDFEDLEIDEASGAFDNEHFSYGTVDPDDTGADVEEAGRISGYRLGYSRSNIEAVWQEGEGLYSGGTEVNLFKDAESASVSLQQQIEGFQRFEGKQYAAGFTLMDFDSFGVEGLGDEAIGLRAHMVAFGEMHVYGTAVYFQVGPLLAAASVQRADDRNVDNEVEDMARALERRIEGALQGEIGGTSTPRDDS